MRIIRTIVPVSIGAFCIEKFIDDKSAGCNFLVVYDCGKGRGSTTSKPLKRIIDSELRGYGKAIDFLFLSHFDNDHINGLSYLIDSGLVNKAYTTVFLPLIQAPHIYLYEYVNNLRFFNTLNVLKQNEIKVVLVEPDGQFGENEAKNVIADNPESEYTYGCTTISSYSSLDSFAKHHLLWKYIPFYLQDNGIYTEFLEYINNYYGITEDHFQNFLVWTDEDKKWLKERYISFRYSKCIYDPEVSPINMNAMLLISDKSEKAKIEAISIKNVKLHDASIGMPKQIGCSALYTSDVGLNSAQYFERVRYAIRNYIDGEVAGLFQIPHHASIHCYNSNTFVLMPFEMAFCNCKRNSLNPIYCAQYEVDARKTNTPYAIVDCYPSHRLVEVILVR